MSNPLDDMINAQQGGGNSVVTQAAKRKQIAAQIIAASSAIPINIINSLNEVMNAFWHQSVDPEKLAAEIDRQTGVPGFCASLFANHAALAQLVATQIPSQATKLLKRPEEYTVTVNPDKSLSIVEKAE